MRTSGERIIKVAMSDQPRKFIYGVLGVVVAGIFLSFFAWSTSSRSQVVADHAGFHVRIDTIQAQLNRIEDKLNGLISSRR